ncbi:AGE family epimerase/isomerase [Nocardioides sp. YIM 152315]|uniref:AGE family epimerase/isomerase n=1 Tax=Nocardioides sp. YIM 152315 TaxID=3031760 RepID=UPI0023DB4515|nr:AGE family epimerase/isomerase [Nocardioides sp. YIM 152315]MDF1604761.1 AGE family epimerase/isomerase [Nocardioides sp. YIM 152315]
MSAHERPEATAVPALTPEGVRLLDFARAARVERGFAWLDDRGRPTPGGGRPTWVAARMTYVWSLASQLGVAGASALAEHGVRALATDHRDPVHGGWYDALDARGDEPTDPGKRAYPHAFVALAAASAAAAGVPGARELLAEAASVLEAHFLDADGRVVEAYDRAFTTQESYRGANASMHMVEALLVVGDVLDEPRWHQTALGIAEHLIHGVARHHDFLLPEHYSPDWEPLPDYHRERPDDPFRPYGCTPGHLLEWSRLLLQLEAALPQAPAWLPDDARHLFETAIRVGWEADGAPGFVYTVDWDGTPVVRSRMHWVVAEAIGAAGALHLRTGERVFRHWSDTWWAYAREHLLDLEHGSWHHELDAANRPAATVWTGKPDVYHAFQATVLPHLPLAPSAPEALRAGTSRPVRWL